jgi:hypothetical protein
MPNPADILSEQVDEDPEDQLRMQLAQGQGNNLAGAPQPPGQAGLAGQGPPPGMAGPQPMAPSPNVPGPLAALAKRPAHGKPHIRLKSKGPPPRKPKPHIKLKASAYGGTI